uniref:PPM-type phosphatase domain-containing protein n=1 Tax=Chromera velia CCMP2878 TaxID=1169474 RepID=A0A0G4HWW2_9ALVE|eukprot:Cvel_9126.t1-p1 / transcript=Cvel_9126.t1 / gene=Cvel_9126 / organism=Chromera_velia_CCMP2878 / gene_product=Probable protein phosphatase 2C 35, putative / transcript_product=Probable protein phosphatase 2C 35, putative / location=Cvel_scaffold519:2391-7443(-) / protein_length=385 / sequence_SO=supercontig / SO=protein_coding / is_pseudo=false
MMFNLLENEDHVLQFFNKARRKFSVSGAPTNTFQRGFDNKAHVASGDSVPLSEVGVGFACKKGWKPESPNQDDFFILRIDDWGLYGVFDGHGPFGHDISNFVQSSLPKVLCSDKDFHDDPKKALRTTFLEMHRLIEEASKKHRFDSALSGTTGTVVLHKPKEGKLFVAHVGDSRCVLARYSDEKKVEGLDLTQDHKPNLDQERKRIVQCGGQVRRLDGDIPFRVFVRGRMYPGLAMSRALGDSVGHSAGVIAEPDVQEYDLVEGRDLFIVICSDGVWEFISSQEAVDLVHSRTIEEVQDAADALASDSWRRWIEEEHNVVDDITVQIIHLFPPKLQKFATPKHRGRSEDMSASALNGGKSEGDGGGGGGGGGSGPLDVSGGGEAQ